MRGEHTATPWELIPADEHHGPYVVNEWGSTVCDLYAMSNPMAPSVRNGGDSRPVPFVDADANAVRIVRCVNLHDELVEVLRAQEELASLTMPGDTAENIVKVRKMRRAVLAKVDATR